MHFAFGDESHTWLGAHPGVMKINRLFQVALGIAAAIAAADATALVVLAGELDSPNTVINDGSSTVESRFDLYRPSALKPTRNACRGAELKVSWTLGASSLSYAAPIQFALKAIGTHLWNTNGTGFRHLKNSSLTPDVCTTYLVIGVDCHFSGSFPGPHEMFFRVAEANYTLNNDGSLPGLASNHLSGRDLSPEQFGFQLAEPTSITLAGLALLGTGFASRRNGA